jgi:hypothetical protein
MRAIVWILVIVAGVVLVSGVVAAIGNGRDHTGETVRAPRWAQDVCGTTGSWEGQIEGIRDEVRDSNFAARQSDGGSGDSVEQTISIREAVDRAIRATTDTLQEGLKRAGIPDVSQGAQASQILINWANQTETNLRIAKGLLKEKPRSPAEAFANLVPPATALAKSALDGRAAFSKVRALDPQLSSALDSSRNCRELMKEAP